MYRCVRPTGASGVIMKSESRNRADRGSSADQPEVAAPDVMPGLWPRSTAWLRALIAAAVAVAVFGAAMLVLRGLHSHAAASRPGSPAATSAGSAPAPGAGLNPQGSPVPVGQAPDSQATNLPLQVYWRFGTSDYMDGHPQVSKSAVHVPDGYSASFVRVDVENRTGKAIGLKPGAFVLSAPGLFVVPSRPNLPNLLPPCAVPAHGAVQGWLLFIKPWWDVMPDGGRVVSQLSYAAPPGARVDLSKRPVPVSRPAGDYMAPTASPHSHEA
jgi:hypothetical protein